MKKIGKLKKMIATPGAGTVQYSLPLGDEQIPLNPYLGKSLTLHATGQIFCVGCGKSIKKSYQQGYCFPCTQRLAQCDLCILKPERCHYHLGTCREPKWGESHCMIPHYVYIANTTGLKVGITRSTQVPTRWLDQGAVSALILYEVPTRRISGFVEVLLAEELSDKTDWRKLLLGSVDDIDLLAAREETLSKMSEGLQKIKSEWGEGSIKFLVEQQPHHFHYPVIEYPTKIRSLSWDKEPTISGTLLGIKGQYLIFDCGVINIRKYTGYVVEIA